MAHEKSRFVEPFYKNYDLYDLGTGPGSGFYSNMHKYKSLLDFRKKKQKRRKRAFLVLACKMSYGLDFSQDQYNYVDMTTMDNGIYNQSIPFGGVYNDDDHLSYLDQDNKGVWNLNHNTDLEDKFDYKEIVKVPQVLNPAEPDLYGFEDGIPRSEKDQLYFPNTYYGIMDFINSDPRNTDWANSTYSKIYS